MGDTGVLQGGFLTSRADRAVPVGAGEILIRSKVLHSDDRALQVGAVNPPYFLCADVGSLLYRDILCGGGGVVLTLFDGVAGLLVPVRGGFRDRARGQGEDRFRQDGQGIAGGDLLHLLVFHRQHNFTEPPKEERPGCNHTGCRQDNFRAAAETLFFSFHWFLLLSDGLFVITPR